MRYFVSYMFRPSEVIIKTTDVLLIHKNTAFKVYNDTKMVNITKYTQL